VTKAYLLMVANPGPWAQIFMSMKTAQNNEMVGSLQLDNAFITLGDFNKSPWYVESGETYLPFGVFAGNGPLNNALSTDVFRVSETAQAVLGWNQYGLNLNMAGYQGIHDVDGLLNANYMNQSGGIFYSLGSSYLNDIRNLHTGVGEGYTSGGGSILSGGRNPAWDVNGSVGTAPFTLVGEYTTTLSGVEEAGVSSGKMNAWMLGVNSKISLWNDPTVLGLSYSGTGNMQDISMPLPGEGAFVKTQNQGMQCQWLGMMAVEVLTNTFIGPELVYDKLYDGKYTTAETFDFSVFF
jgi:hypothetical protein